MFENLLYYIKELFFIFRFWSHLLWIKFNKWFCIFTDTDRKKCHKIVIIGDGFAEGFGDYIIMGSQPGLSHFLQSEIKSDLNVSFAIEYFI